jgi:hypothetical protein
MATVRLILKLLTYVIYICFGVTLLAFPAVSLLEYIAQQTRLFSFDFAPSIQNVILPGLLLAVFYAIIMALQRRLQPKSLPDRPQLKEEHSASP